MCGSKCANTFTTPGNTITMNALMKHNYNLHVIAKPHVHEHMLIQDAVHTQTVINASL